MDIKEQLRKALACEQPLQILTELVRNLLAQSWERDRILTECESLRKELRQEGKEDEEDIVLELMDFLTGYCSPHMKL
jgi:hypothetical protein